jgi:HEAT repeat protein
MTADSLLIILTIDTHLQVTSWNERLTVITGISADTAQGQPLTHLWSELATNGALTYFHRVLETGTIETFDRALHPYLFKCRPLHASPYFDVMQQRVTVAPLRQDGELIGLVISLEDITEEKTEERQLVERLDHPDENVRLRTIETLVSIERINPEPLLVKALGDESWRVRRSAVEGLAQRGGSTMAITLLRELREEHRNPSVLNSVLQVMAHSQVDVVPALIDCLNDPEADLRIYAALALGEQHDRRAVPALIRLLHDPDTNVRYHAIDALGHLRAPEAVEPLLDIAQSRDFFLAFPALDALMRIGDPAVAPFLVPLLEDELLCTAAADALGQLGDASVVPALTVLLNQPSRPVGAIAAAIANLYSRYQTTYKEGSYIGDLVRSAIDLTGINNLVSALHQATPEELPPLVLLLGQLNNSQADTALAQLLGQPQVQKTVVQALVSHGKQVTELLIEQLLAPEIETRRAAVIALGQIGDAQAVPVLLERLDADPDLLIPIADALAQIGDHRAFGSLLNLAGHPNAVVRQAVVAALNSLGHPQMLPYVMERLQDRDPNVRESAVKIAGYFAFSECIPLLLDCCRDSYEQVRRAAIELIPYLENESVLSVLVEALQTDTPKVRAAATRALGQVDRAFALPYLLTTLQDSDAWVRYYGARSLGIHGCLEALDPLTELAQSDPAHPVRIAAVEALGRIGGLRALNTLIPLAEKGAGSSDLTRAALMALGEIAHPSALPPLLTALRSSDPDRRIYSIQALGKRGGAGVEAALQNVASLDLEVSVVQAAIQALTQLATPEAIAALMDLTANPTRNEACIIALSTLDVTQIEAIGRGLNHPKSEVRRAAVEVLTRMKHPRASECLMLALDDQETSVRLAAVKALEHLGYVSAERKLAVMAHTDPDLSVRRAAQKGLKA